MAFRAVGAPNNENADNLIDPVDRDLDPSPETYFWLDGKVLSGHGLEYQNFGYRTVMISNSENSTPLVMATPVMETPSDHTTLTEVVDGYRAAGFDRDFWAEEGTSIRCNHCDSVLAAGRFTMHSLRRLEGASDPDDMVAVVASTCPVCQSNGTLVLGYGPMSSRTDADVLVALQDHRCSAVLPPDSGPADEPQSTGPAREH